MCARLGRSGTIRPGTLQIVKTQGGTRLMTYGFGNGYQYNARWEKINSTYERIHDNRAILKVPSFWEGKAEFIRSDSKPFNIGLIFSPISEFAILTTEPNEIVRPYHNRMPLCIPDDKVDKFLNGEDNIRQLDSGLFIIDNHKLAA